ncbi:thiamine pyrophosphate-binding protein [Rhodococcus triatomae]|nr:Thiamine pyrophosphate-bindin protein [Rhodococcus triatomae BKS 15-14]
MASVTGGQLAARTLASFGVEAVFGVHGGHLDSFLVESDRLGIRIVDHRHEAAAGNAAEGYARVTGGLGVAFATSGPGYANVFSSVCNAAADRVPLLVVTSSPPLRETELNALQDGLDQVGTAKMVAKWAHRVTTVTRVPDLVALAVRHATTGVPGPVVLDIPIDVMFRSVEEELAATPSLAVPAPAAPSAATVDRLVEILGDAERPVIFTGGRASMSGGFRAALEALLADLRIPVFGVSWGLGLLAPDHPCWCGNSADAAALQFMAAPPDVVVLVGARRGPMTGSRNATMIPTGARVIHVDLDATQPGRIDDVALSVNADAAETISALARHVGRLPGWPDWTAAARGAANAHGLLYAREPAQSERGLHPYWASKAIVDALTPDTIVVYDGGESAAWTSFFARSERPRSWFGLGALGGLGVGPGMAIGAQVAGPSRPVVLITGDGGIGFHLQEFDTMVRHGLPITTVVMNNAGWAMSQHGQSALYGPDTAVAVDLPDTRYDAVARAFGCAGERVESIDDLAPAVEKAQKSGRPTCIDVTVSPVPVHPIMADLSSELRAGATRVPYYEPIPEGEV